MSQKKIAILGAGFSGLTLAWALTKQGLQVEIFEATDRCGGLLGTDRHPIPVEKAANALLASQSVEELFADLNIKPLQAGHRSKKRFIFRKEPRSFPVSKGLAFITVLKAIFGLLTKTINPKENEMVSSWAARSLNSEFNDYLVSPAFQGIYGDTSDQLSAELIIGGALNKSLSPKKGTLHGSVSADGGMQTLIDGLHQFLNSKNVPIHLNEKLINAQDFAAVVVATSIDDACKSIANQAPNAAHLLSQVPMLPITTATLGFEKEKPISGFGCLFPSKENFNSLGVLFNTDIFSGRGPLTSETWILNKNQNVLESIAEDRQRMTGQQEKPVFSKITKYQKALPLYGLQLKKFLISDVFVRSERLELFEVFKNGARLKESIKPLYLTGNYLGGIGLAKILDYNLRLTERIKKDLQ